ncbi:unnamed protein product, partial [Didymodactylos carnosus]
MMPRKMDDGLTVEFTLPLILETRELHQVDIDDIGPLVTEILEQSDKHVGKELMCVGEVEQFQNVPKISTKVT